MVRIVQHPAIDLPDVADFLAVLDSPQGAFFESGAEIFVGRAPGRLDVMGGIADYSGSLVLQLPLAEATFAAVARERSRAVRILTTSGPETFDMGLDDLEACGEPFAYESARAWFEPHRWAAYVAGAFLVLRRETGARFEGGARILVHSAVPQGKGVSSSAALEVASMRAIAVAYGLPLPPRELALLCQKVENLVAGAPCGVMDQMTAACGKASHLLALLCRPAEVEGFVPIPEEIAFWGLDSGVRHSVSGSDYGSVRAGAFMGRRIISELRGRPVRHLTEIAPAEFEEPYAARLPERISGAEFLARYGATGDQATEVEPAREYAVRAPARHPVYEHFRVRLFRALLAGGDLELLGELMFQSHASYSACGLGSEATDLLVKLVKEAGPARGLYGAKITGGGSGGTVAVLGRRDARASVEAIAEKYALLTGYRPYLFSGSSPGADDFGYLKVERC